MKRMDEEVVYDGKWTKMIKAGWQHGEAEGSWEYISRKGDGRGIVIIPFYFEDNQRTFILIKQKRVPTDSYVIEFPAGLVDEGEELEASALRELQEETGAQGNVLEISPPLTTSAGLSNEIIHMVVVEVTGFTDTNLDLSEDIEVMFVKEKEIEKFLEDMAEASLLIDNKVWLFLKTILEDSI